MTDVELVALLPDAAALTPLFQYRDAKLAVVAGWSGELEPVIRSFANGQPTPQHGTHVDGFFAALRAALPGHRRESLQRARGWTSLVLAVEHDGITYAGPTKGQVAAPELAVLVEQRLTAPLVEFFTGAGTAVLSAFEE